MTTAAKSRRPRVICHMMASIDGRVVTREWPDLGEGRGEYERIAATYGADAWMCGRITMESFAATVRDADDVVGKTAAQPVVDRRADFIATGARPPYAVAIDPRGRLLWQTPYPVVIACSLTDPFPWTQMGKEYSPSSASS